MRWVGLVGLRPRAEAEDALLVELVEEHGAMRWGRRLALRPALLRIQTKVGGGFDRFHPSLQLCGDG